MKSKDKTNTTQADTFDQYTDYYKQIRREEIDKTPKEFARLMSKNEWAKDLMNRKITKESEDGTIVIQKGYNTPLSDKTGKVAKLSKSIATNPGILSGSIITTVIGTLNASPAFALIGVSTIASLILVSLVTQKVNDKVIDANIEKIATHIADEKAKNNYKKEVTNSIRELRDVNNIKKSALTKS